jgi:hypothetical protein
MSRYELLVINHVPYMIRLHKVSVTHVFVKGCSFCYLHRCWKQAVPALSMVCCDAR